jgi:hypothetical protein
VCFASAKAKDRLFLGERFHGHLEKVLFGLLAARRGERGNSCRVSGPAHFHGPFGVCGHLSKA